MAERSRIRLEVEGLVQGVGFRPTVHRLTTQLSLSGFIRNTPQGAELELEGAPAQVAQFVPLLQQQAPFPFLPPERWGFTSSPVWESTPRTPR